LCKAADVFFPEFFVLAEDFPTQCRRLLKLFLSNQVAEILQADSLRDTTSIYPSAENPCLIFKPTFNFKRLTELLLTYLHCVQKKNTNSYFLSYLHALFVDLNKNCSEYTQGTVDSDHVEIRYSLRPVTSL